MGAPPAGITKADFLTPPELARWRLAANPAGRIGGVRLTLIGDNSATRMGDCYQQIPLRVLPPFDLGHGQPKLIYLLNPTAGLMDGDAHLVHLQARGKTRAVVVGQAATRIHPAIQGYCSQRWVVRVDREATLVVLPGPTIPFAGSRYYNDIDIDLADGANLVWGDIWLAGRYARGDHSERFQFDTLVQQFVVRREGRLVFRDRFCWQGPWNAAQAAWHFGGEEAAGSLFMTGKASQPLPPSAPEVRHCELRTEGGDYSLRLCGAAEAVTAWVVQKALIWGAQLANATDRLPWLEPGNHLGPNHWFSLPPGNAVGQ